MKTKRAIKVDHIKFEIPKPRIACQIRDQSTGKAYSDRKPYTSKNYKGSDFTHVRITVTSGDPTFTLRGAGSTDTCTKSAVGPSGPQVFVELKLGETNKDCTFDWKLIAGSPPCTLTIIIKKS